MIFELKFANKLGYASHEADFICGRMDMGTRAYIPVHPNETAEGIEATTDKEDTLCPDCRKVLESNAHAKA
jgi:hypothetical protein